MSELIRTGYSHERWELKIREGCMKISSLQIKNFRGIREVSLQDLGSMIIIAGQNGSGKSCIFDAIRLLKSVYGGYQANEWQQWMGEFQISLTNKASDFYSIFNDRNSELSITCEFKLSEQERKYIADHCDELLREKVWRNLIPEVYVSGAHQTAMFAANHRQREPEVSALVEQERGILMTELANHYIRGRLFIMPGEVPQIELSVALSVIFGAFKPNEIGVIDYHGAQRHYGRESVQGINLNLENNEQQRSQTALYNYAAKYSNVKGEMAASYVREILTEAAGVPRAEQSTLTNTLTELFKTFFPDKKFLGPQPTIQGGLTFPVETQSGARHDLDELSSGEKEILYGYLRIRNSAPRYSMILLDEPELHLNPRLIRGLPNFYKKYLGEDLENQIWLVTHSDALLREVVGQTAYNVFHMLASGKTEDGESQVKRLSATGDLDLALVDLVGDLAAYRPNGKVVIFEGGGDSDFDQKVVSKLFPELHEQANLISGSNKVRVRALQEILDRASIEGKLPFKFYSVTDKDSDKNVKLAASEKTFSWDVYHIENYFLEPKLITKVMSSLQLNDAPDENLIWERLRMCAQETLGEIIRHELEVHANSLLIPAINIGTDRKAADISGSLIEAVNRSLQKIERIRAESLDEASLRTLQEKIENQYEKSIADGSWVKLVRGRDVLKRFVSRYGKGVSYEVFRNLILNQMKDQGFRPPGMKAVIDKILEK